MNKKEITDILQGIFERIMSSGRTDEAVNPAVTFASDAEHGKMDGMSDKEYKRQMKNAQYLSWLFFNNEPRATAEKMLETFIRHSTLNEISIRHIADMMARTSPVPKEDRLSKAIHEQIITDVQDYSKKFSFDYTDNDWLQERPEYEQGTAWTPQTIYDMLNEKVYRQTAAKKAAATLVYNHMHGHKRNLLLAGPSGCGKTEIFRQLKNIYPHIIITDAAQITPEGYVGENKFSTIFHDMSKSEAEHAIIVLDEADKMFETKPSRRADSSYTLQNELLKYLEGDTIEISAGDREGTKKLSMKNVSFVFLGTFETMIKNKTNAGKHNIGFASAHKQSETHPVYTSDDLIKYAHVRREIAGRINTIVQLDELSTDDYRYILHSHTMGPLAELQTEYGISITLDPTEEKKMIRNAVQKKLGVRYIRSYLQTMLDDAMFHDPTAAKYNLPYQNGQTTDHTRDYMNNTDSAESSEQKSLKHAEIIEGSSPDKDII